MPLSEFLLREVSEGNNLSIPEGRARTQYVAKPLLQALQPSALRLQVVRSLAHLTQTSPAEIESMFALIKPIAKFRRTPSRGDRPRLVGLERQIMRLLLAHPRLASELGEKEIAAFVQYAPNSAESLKEILEAIRVVGSEPSFAFLSEQLRARGESFDQLIAEIAGNYDFDLDQARVELMDAIRQIKITVITHELKELSASNLPISEVKLRHSELMFQKSQLLKQAQDGKVHNKELDRRW